MRRRPGKVDRLPQEMRGAVGQMRRSGIAYREISEYLQTKGFSLSRMAICTYAKRFLPAAQMLHIAQAVAKNNNTK